MILATTAPRYVAAPWEREALAGVRAVVVGREAEVQPDPGPLAEYQSVFPWRYVRFEVKRQLWEIRQVNPDSGVDERVELVFTWDCPPEADGTVLSEEELAEAIQNQKPSLVKRYAHFDYPFVRRRIREWYEFQHRGGAKGLSAKLAKAQEIRDATRRRDFAREGAAAWNEIRRYLPCIAALHAGATESEALSVKIPQVAVGLSLKPAASSPSSSEILTCH